MVNSFHNFGFQFHKGTITTGHNELDCITVKSCHLGTTLRAHGFPPDYQWITRTPGGNYDVWVRRPNPEVFNRPFVGFIGQAPVTLPYIARSSRHA